ncbi:MAG: Dabb family protein [Nitrospirales bacterium]
MGARRGCQLILVVWLLGLATACQTVPQEGPRPGIVRHVVILWLKEPGNLEARRKLIDSAKTLRAIPEVVDVRAGQVLTQVSPAADTTYDVVLVFGLRDPEAVKTYREHPLHKQVLADIVQPLVSRFVVYDFLEE